MKPQLSTSDPAITAPADVDWSVTITESLPDCPSVEAGWERIATQTGWGEWRSASKMRGEDVSTSLVPPATEPLKTGDDYVVKVGRFVKIHCRVLESSSPESLTSEDEEMVFDALGVALGGIVMARAQEKIRSLPLFTPPRQTLESEHRHTFQDLNKSFLSPPR